MTTVVLPKKRLSKEERLRLWVDKAMYYTTKERITKLMPKPFEIYTADLGENTGSEINGVRPFIVFTSTNYNQNSGTVTGAPCSLKEFAKKGQVKITDDILLEGKVEGIIKIEMLTTISKGRLGDYIGRLNRKGELVVARKVEDFLVPLSRKKHHYYYKN